MQKSILVLPDGTELSSGRGTANALMNVELKEVVNSNTELTPGSVCCACLEATLIAPGGALSISAGTEVIAYTEYDDGSREQNGIFTLEKPTRSSANTYKLIAYDHVAKLDVDLSAWFAEQAKAFPMKMQDLVILVCEKCGVALANDSIPHGNSVVNYMAIGEVTGRKLLQWAAQISARFVHATPEGELEFAWYKKKTTLCIAPSRIKADGVTSIPYFEGSLTYEDYEVASVEKVQIRNSDDDVGVVWPSDLEEGNTYVVSTNYLLASMSASELDYVAQSIYQALMNFTYVPCKVSIPRGSGLKAGDIVTVTDANGVTFDTCIMTRTVSAGKEVLECTGSPSRGSSTAVNNRNYEALTGKVLSIKTAVDGLKVENKDLKDNYAKLSLSVEDISAEVADAKGDIATLLLAAGQVSVTAADDKGTLTTAIKSDGTWEAKYIDANGNELSGLTFDFTKQSFVFKGTGEFTGNLDIGEGNFVVDEFGNVTAKGTTKIYSRNADGTTSSVYLRMYANALQLIDENLVFPLFHVGYTSDGDSIKNPYILLNSKENEGEEWTPALMQQFSDGLWLGNNAVIFRTGAFEANEDCNGIFISFTEKKVYSVDGTEMKSVHTGEAIARFG